MKVLMRFVRRPLRMRIRSRLVSGIAGAMNWTSDVFAPRDICGPIEWRDRVRWACEDMLSRLFDLAYRGSDEELRDAEDIPEQYRSNRQRRFLAGGEA